VNEDRGSRYHRQRRRATAASVALTAALLLTLLLSGAGGWLRDQAHRLAGPSDGGFGPFALAVVLFVAALLALQEVVGFPLTFYRGYLLERRYGLSRETPRAWLRDHARASAVGLAFALTAALAVYAAIYFTPRWWWLMAAALAAGAAVLLSYFLPTVLLPLFYRMEPLDRPGLRDRLLALTEAHGVRALGVHVWGLGEKTRKANGALVGLGRTRRILLSDTLLAEYSDDEIEVILAHELSHHVHGDILKAIALEGVIALCAAWSAHALLAAAGPSLGLYSPRDLAAMPLMLLGAGTLSLLMMPIANAISRQNERKADRFALQLTGRPDAFISAMRRLGAQNLAEERPSALVRVLFYTHPPLDERVAMARASLLTGPPVRRAYSDSRRPV
jgi:STE24 endopeptidase